MFRIYWIEQGLKPVTVNGIISAVKNYFDFLVEEGILDGNPIVLKRLRIKVDKPLPAFMTPEELKVFSNWLTTTPRNVALGFHNAGNRYARKRGYLIKIIADARHPEHGRMLAWGLSQGYKDFDLARVNRDLRYGYRI